MRATAGSMLRMRVLALAALVAAAAPLPASALLVNNGLAPPNAANVIDTDVLSPSFDSLHVRNVGCGSPAPNSPCATPGAATSVAVTADIGSPSGLNVYDSSSLELDSITAQAVRARDSSQLEIGSSNLLGTVTVDAGATANISDSTLSALSSAGATNLFDTTVQNSITATANAQLLLDGGGVFFNLVATDTAFVELIGFAIGGMLQVDANATVRLHDAAFTGLNPLFVSDDASVRVLGGEVPDFSASDDALVELVGSDFQLDGVDVELGEVAAMFGVLSGTLADGSAFSANFDRSANSRVLLTPEPGAGALATLGFAWLGWVRRSR